jgi:GNAT superfamily N-acetyltransferase
MSEGDVEQNLSFEPLTPERWADFEELFGSHGAYGGCWCMWWRLSRREFERNQGQGNRSAMKAIVDSGEVPGILGFAQGRAVAWCSVAPREQFASLERSRVMKRLDDQPVWSIVCLYVDKRSRGKGVAEQAIQAAIEHARGKGARVIEAYPTVPREGQLPPVSSFMGVPSMYERSGFVKCAQPSRSRLVMRCTLE